MDALLTLVFSAKESFYKGISSLVRRVLEFDVIELVEIDVAGGTLSFDVRQALDGLFQPGYRVRVDFSADASRVLTCFLRPAT
jgi:enterobactin synthetase component D